jgi:hypothetical protein
MISGNVWKLIGRRWSLLVLVLVAAAGCSGRQSSESRVKKALADAGAKASALYQLAGTVTVDGMPPESKELKSLVAVLYDPQKPDEEPAFTLVRITFWLLRFSGGIDGPSTVQTGSTIFTTTPT